MSKFYRLLFFLHLISFVEIYNYRGCCYMCCNCWKYCFNKKAYLENQQNNSFNKISEYPFQNSKNGLVGLRNPYKSCYMNTALQCLSNCWELTEYFFSNKYKSSKEDSLATAYKVVLEHLWLGSEAVFDPVNFRTTAGNYDKKWDGKTQQDTYEFLIFLLKSLHEDLNNSLNKIAQNSLDEVVQSQISWNNFGGGRQSVVDDLFYGEFISTTACPQKNCEDKEKSVSHFLALLLPIPQSTDQKLKEEEKKEVKEEEKKEDNKEEKEEEKKDKKKEDKKEEKKDEKKEDKKEEKKEEKKDKKEEKDIDDCLEFFLEKKNYLKIMNCIVKNVKNNNKKKRKKK